MNRIKEIIGVVIVAFVAASCGNPKESYTVTEQTFNEAVYASGELYPEEYHIIKSSVPDRILKILVSEGDRVKTGDALVILGTPADNNQLEILNNQVVIAKGNAKENSAALTELQHKITLAKQQFEHDERNANRYRELLQSKAVSQKDAEQVAMTAETSLANYKNLQQQYITQKNELTNRLLDAERQLTEARQSQQTKALTSRISGKVYNLNFKEGEPVNANEAILMVGSPSRYKLELLVDGRDINKISIGQKIFFETDAFKGEPFEAVITKIDPVLQKETRSFKVEARVEVSRNFYPQSSIEANIIIREKATVLMIPSDYLRKGDSVLFQPANGEITKVKVTAGSRTDNFIEITNGLKVGDIILKEQ
jgi:multidrug efflux pump subunit AcrA (membrane-fusion protein)